MTRASPPHLDYLTQVLDEPIGHQRAHHLANDSDKLVRVVAHVVQLVEGHSQRAASGGAVPGSPVRDLSAPQAGFADACRTHATLRASCR
jgi:hypothetical protein